MTKPRTFTGRARERTTPRRVRLAERLSHLFITAGGIGTIVTVALIFVFLLWVVMPLFRGVELEEGPRIALPGQTGGYLACGTDEFRLMAWSLDHAGTLRLMRLDTGERLDERPLFGTEEHPTAWTFLPEGREAAFGFADGTVRSGRIGFRTSFLSAEEAPPEIRALKPGERARLGSGMVQALPDGLYRRQELALDMGAPLAACDAAIRLLDRSATPSGTVYAALDVNGGLALLREKQVENMLTGETETRLKRRALPYREPAGRGPPAHLLLSGTGSQVYLVWRDGFLSRYSTDHESGGEAETTKLVDAGTEVTTIRFQIGKTTFLVGDTRGGIRAWFPIKPPDAGTLDGSVLVCAHVFDPGPGAVTVIAPSPRSRLFAAGYAGGAVDILFGTTGAVLAKAGGEGQGAVDGLAFSPKQDGLIAFRRDGVQVWQVDAGYPEASMRALFLPVWYEESLKPEWVWQSTGGSDDFQAKLGLVPLIFGTLKATFYSILIAAPLALLAALFTSEFLDPRHRARVKSVIEMMASLPSVVLGFLAALVIAPFVQNVLPATLAAFVTVPLALLLGARLWQMLPSRAAIRASGLPRLGAIAVMLLLGVLLASAVGGPFERAFFAGDIKRWLGDPGFGSGAGGFTIILFPLCALGITVLSAWLLGPWLRRISAAWTPMRCALVDLAKFGAVFFVSLGAASVAAFGLTWLGADPRGGLLDTYTQRNCLVVGVVMGFAVVPIIYTLAEDALSSVPRQLREGSLGAGASQWQTAWRIVIPTAMSGLFGALMVGLGRAVGETMIVLMALGNTPIMEWNIFNGARTLSANIAVELPEAVRDSAHYRTLFFSALVLFAMTFVINTFAELVRRRFRRRSAQL